MPALPSLTDQEPIYQVSDLNAEAKFLLEESFQTVWVIGEISNKVLAHSGHLYFSLKDARAVIRCALFKTSAQRLNFLPENGQQVLLQARVTLYEARGDFQLVIQQMHPAGEGLLQITFLQLKQKLAQEGLFDPVHKKIPPRFPNTIGVITSATGAAIRDIIKVIHRRCPTIGIIIYPTLVQGQQAAPNIADTIATANRRHECDVLLLARGGGSLEDLWAFNEEIVARAIFASELPIVTGIGHEIDFTIADFVADVRAPTPSAAAEITTPDLHQWLLQFSQCYQRLLRQLQQEFQQTKIQLHTLQQRLRHPKQQLDVFTQQLTSLCQRLLISSQQLFEHSQQCLTHLAQQLHTVSPLKTLERGYAIATHADTGVIIRDEKQVKPNDNIYIELAAGKLLAQILPNSDISHRTAMAGVPPTRRSFV
ncbi:MAG: hypothetical protein A3F10_01710 [Coxiella sp. RIFCSPHIGHO2_12_FULL_42_15]|nr:MAG: hypothetical protein A3F10_01710 [Coxiella sp. RIFCSPHIGHO2_12_FULL_42_15]